MAKSKFHLKIKRNNLYIALGVIFAVAAVGLILHLASRASGPYTKAEAESGTLASPATLQSDSSASGGKYVQFGTASTGSIVPLQGFFVSNQSPSSVTSLGNSIGATTNAMTMYTTGSGSFSTIGSWTPPSTSLRVLLSVNMNPDNSDPTQVPANQGVFKTLAQNLVNGNQANAIIRIGWEWSGNWFAWSKSGPAAYVTAFDDIVTQMRSVSGQHFMFDWCSNAGSTPTSGTWASWYPGDNYVDIIGSDHYDSTSSTSPSAATANWNNNLNQPGGLAYTVNFAAAHNKYVSIPEWGLNGVDDPTYIDLMSAFVKNPANRVYYESYFSDALSINSDITQFHNSYVEFGKDF